MLSEALEGVELHKSREGCLLTATFGSLYCQCSIKQKTLFENLQGKVLTKPLADHNPQSTMPQDDESFVD